MCKFVFLSVMLLGCIAIAQGQVSGYAMGSYGFHTNPLYNYEGLSDQVREGYWELNFTEPSPGTQFRAGYVGGLMIFNRLEGRNYYEHRLDLAYTAKFPTGQQAQPAMKESDNDEEEAEEPFRGRILDVGLRVGARHDKEIYRAFDNLGLEIPLSFTWGVGSGTEFKIAQQAGIRRYYFLAELNNISDVLEAWLTTDVAKRMQLGFSATAGVKHYTTNEIDTSRIETATTTFARGNQGKGKGGSGLSGQNGGGNSGKKKEILVNSTTTNTYQVTLGVTGTWKWESGNANAELLYRLNPKSQVRFLAQYVNTSLLTQDIYNDSFSYGGPGLKIGLRQDLPYGLQLTVRGECQRKKFLAPALDLTGIETSSNRVDLHGALEGTLSKTISLNESITLEIAFNSGIARNKSDDAYNDYSLSFYSISVGVGF